jgi:hypothetical protein
VILQITHLAVIGGGISLQRDLFTHDAPKNRI